MAFENFPSAGSQDPQRTLAPKTANLKGLLTGGLMVALLGTWGYIIYDKNKSKESIQQKETLLASTNTEKDELKKDLENATMLYDELKTTNAKQDSTITARDKEIQDKKSRIQSLLNKVDATKGDLATARRLIASLNGDIAGYKAQVEQLKGENQVLVQEKTIVTEERDLVRREYDSAKVVLGKKEQEVKEKEEVISVGSTLRAYNFDIKGINEKGGGKEKISDNIKKVDKLRISFDLDENRIAQSGAKDIFVCITDPEGKPVAIEAAGSGKFSTRQGEEKVFTKKLDVTYTQGQRQTVNFDWKQDSKFNKGSYKIEVFHNGFKIGEGSRSLKKYFISV